MIRVLCLDIEGGYGGSSRSLHYSLKTIDRSQVQPEVWCRKSGPIQALYEPLEIPCQVVPELTNVVPMPRNLNTLYDYANAVLRRHINRAFHVDLARQVDERFDLVHFNHSGLFSLAAWLRKRTAVPFTMHFRKLFPDTRFARFQVNTISRVINHLVFITENEQRNYEELGGQAPGTVIYNIVEEPPMTVEPHSALTDDRRFKVASLSNFALTRGTDRIVDIAAAIPNSARGQFLFVMAGNMGLSRSFSGALGRIARAGGTLVDYAAERGVSDMFLFLGHVSEPERVLTACDILLKPTRLDFPWGRDVLEAMACGKPVVTCGTCERFVEDQKTGYLHAAFDPAEFARDIQALADDANLRSRFGQAGRKRVRNLCSGLARSADLERVWRGTVTR